MPYLIDGHNLIAKIPGISLDEIDDENRLVEMLQEYCQRQNRTAEVFFDNSQPGQPRARVFGRVTARYVRTGKTADQAIFERLGQLKKNARNWTVVSSDHQVRSEARAARAVSLSSEEFARKLTTTLNSPTGPGEMNPREMKNEDLDDWMELFKIDPDQD